MAAKIYQYSGTGHGLLSGVTEYIFITEDDNFDIDDNCAPGFTHDHTYDIDGDELEMLPMDQLLCHK
jgi:hypothetical protein